MAVEPGNVTRLLEAVTAGDQEAWNALIAAVYNELRRIAASRMETEGRRLTLQPTALVHEAYLRLIGSREPCWRSRGDFFAAAAEAMRRILVDHARYKKAAKRRPELDSVPFDGAHEVIAVPEPDPAEALDLEILDAALARLELDPQNREKATVVKLRYFAGLTLEQTADALGKSVATVKRDWAFARAWLYREITRDRNQ